MFPFIGVSGFCSRSDDGIQEVAQELDSFIYILDSLHGRKIKASKARGCVRENNSLETIDGSFEFRFGFGSDVNRERGEHG